MTVDLGAVHARRDAYLISHDHPGSFACCTAHASADDVPGLLAELEALNTRRVPRPPCPMGAGCTVDHLPTSEGA